MFVITVHAILDAVDKAAVFGKDVIEDDDERMTGPRFFKKEEMHRLLYSSHKPNIVASKALCFCCKLWEIFQLVFHCIAGAHAQSCVLQA